MEIAAGLFKAQDGRLRVSVISVWEVAMLEAKGRLVLAGDCNNWVREALNAPGIRPMEMNYPAASSGVSIGVTDSHNVASRGESDPERLTPQIAISSTRLPGEFHGDPRVFLAVPR